MNRKKNIFVAVTGLTPQVVTEAIYALALAEKPWIPDEIHLITTREGAHRARLALLREGKGMLQRLIDDYQLPPITFDEAHIHIVPDAQGEPLNDIRTPEDNSAVADFITTTLQQLTQEEDNELHVSIAGGRKTMGYYMGYALSLYGRPQDRLSHVLVSEPFESCWDFFYPTPYAQVIQTRDDNLADCQDAEVTLAEIPFVCMRYGLDDDLLTGQTSFSEAVQAAQRTLEPPRLAIDLSGQKIKAGGVTIELPPRELALYAVFANNLLNREPPLPAPPKDAPDQDWAERFLTCYRAIRSGQADDTDRTEEALKKGMDGDYFSNAKSKLHRYLRKALGGAAAEAYYIDSGRVRPGQYRLKLMPEAVQFASLATVDGCKGE